MLKALALACTALCAAAPASAAVYVKTVDLSKLFTTPSKPVTVNAYGAVTLKPAIPRFPTKLGTLTALDVALDIAVVQTIKGSFRPDQRIGDVELLNGVAVYGHDYDQSLFFNIGPNTKSIELEFPLTYSASYRFGLDRLQDLYSTTAERALFTNGNLTGALTATAKGKALYTISYTYNLVLPTALAGAAGSNIAIGGGAVPAPGSAWLAFAGAVSLLAVRRRMRG